MFFLIFCRFDLDLETFGVNFRVLQDVKITRELIDWTEDWDKVLKWKNCLVVEARFLIKYNNLSYEYDNGPRFTFYKGNCEFRHGRPGGWQIIGIFEDKVFEDETFCPFLAVTMICVFQLSEGIKVQKPPPGSPEERQYDQTEDLVKE